MSAFEINVVKNNNTCTRFTEIEADKLMSNWEVTLKKTVQDISHGWTRDETTRCNGQ